MAVQEFDQELSAALAQKLVDVRGIAVVVRMVVGLENLKNGKNNSKIQPGISGLPGICGRPGVGTPGTSGRPGTGLPGTKI